jgi:hypothetical protein
MGRLPANSAGAHNSAALPGVLGQLPLPTEALLGPSTGLLPAVLLSVTPGIITRSLLYTLVFSCCCFVAAASNRQLALLLALLQALPCSQQSGELRCRRPDCWRWLHGESQPLLMIRFASCGFMVERLCLYCRLQQPEIKD